MHAGAYLVSTLPDAARRVSSCLHTDPHSDGISVFIGGIN